MQLKLSFELSLCDASMYSWIYDFSRRVLCDLGDRNWIAVKELNFSYSTILGEPYELLCLPSMVT